MVSGTRRLFSEQLRCGTLHFDSFDERSRRSAAQEQPPHRATWQRPFRLHWPGVFPAVARRCARRVSVVCQFGFTREMNKSSAESISKDESPGVPGFKTWRGVYLFVFAFFVVC